MSDAALRMSFADASAFRQPTAGAVALTHIHALLRNHSLHLSPSELYELYHNQVHPALPILPQGSTETQLPLLLGSIIATALSHSKRTRELAASVAGMLEISYAGLGEYNLSGVASAVLDLGMRGVNSSRASYLLLAKVSFRVLSPLTRRRSLSRKC